MKKFWMLATAMVLYLSAQAEDYTYPYLVFTNSDGTQTTVAVDGLEITFNNGKLVVTNSAGIQQTLTLAELTSMQFEASSTPTLLSAVKNEGSDNVVYDLLGRRAIRTADGQLRRGVYVIKKADGTTQKISVK